MSRTLDIERGAIGAPTKLTPERHARIVELIGKGLTYTLAAQAAGVGYSSFRLWVLKGQRDERAGIESVYSKFSTDVKAAEGLQAEALLDLVRGHAQEAWQAAAWMLERRHGYTRPPTQKGGRVDLDEEDAFLTSLEDEG